MTETLKPTFFGHGSPMNAIETNRYSQAWREYGRSIPTPRAVLAISAHWYIGATAITTMNVPRTIHDFYGFPQPLFDFQYPAPGDSEVAKEVIDCVKPLWVGSDEDTWGLDHGTWSILCHMFPEANVPVLQLSIDSTKDFSYHFDLGRKLAALSEQGVLIMGSGNVVHNLRRIDWSSPDGVFDWAREFDLTVSDILATDPKAILGIEDNKNYRLSSPTPDHFLPLVYLAGMAYETKSDISKIIEGFNYGSLSMAAYSL